ESQSPEEVRPRSSPEPTLRALQVTDEVDTPFEAQRRSCTTPLACEMPTTTSESPHSPLYEPKAQSPVLASRRESPLNGVTVAAVELHDARPCSHWSMCSLSSDVCTETPVRAWFVAHSPFQLPTLQSPSPV